MDDIRHSGFTLIELLVAVAIVTLLAGVAVPAMGRHIDNARLRGAAEALLQELRQARNHALSYQQPVYFSFSSPPANNWCYGWSVGKACDCQHPGSCTSNAGRHRIAADFPSVALRTRTTSGKQVVAFSPVRATARADSIRLSNRSGTIKAIVSPLGRVRICAQTGSLYPKC